MTIASEYYLFMKSTVENIKESFSINNIGLYSQFDLDSNLFTVTAISRSINTYQFDSSYFFSTPTGSSISNVLAKDIVS